MDARQAVNGRKPKAAAESGPKALAADASKGKGAVASGSVPANVRPQRGGPKPATDGCEGVEVSGGGVGEPTEGQQRAAAPSRGAKRARADEAGEDVETEGSDTYRPRSRARQQQPSVAEAAQAAAKDGGPRASERASKVKAEKVNKSDLEGTAMHKEEPESQASSKAAGSGSKGAKVKHEQATKSEQDDLARTTKDDAANEGDGCEVPTEVKGRGRGRAAAQKAGEVKIERAGRVTETEPASAAEEPNQGVKAKARAKPERAEQRDAPATQPAAAGRGRGGARGRAKDGPEEEAPSTPRRDEAAAAPGSAGRLRARAAASPTQGGKRKLLFTGVESAPWESGLARMGGEVVAEPAECTHLVVNEVSARGMCPRHALRAEG